jgi:hypothetical protein
MDELIRRRGTGTAEEFAETLGISVSVLKRTLMRCALWARKLSFAATAKATVIKIVLAYR